MDAALRYYPVEEILTAADAGLVERVHRAPVALTSRLDAELYGNKGALAMLSDDRHRGAFSATELARINRVLPWTRPLRAAGTDPAAPRSTCPRTRRRTGRISS